MTKTIYSYLICYKDGTNDGKFKSLQNLNFNPSNPTLTIDSVNHEGILLSRETIACSEIRSLTIYND